MFVDGWLALSKPEGNGLRNGIGPSVAYPPRKVPVGRVRL